MALGFDSMFPDINSFSLDTQKLNLRHTTLENKLHSCRDLSAKKEKERKETLSVKFI